jgi:hypothetical protein
MAGHAMLGRRTVHSEGRQQHAVVHHLHLRL